MCKRVSKRQAAAVSHCGSFLFFCGDHGSPICSLARYTGYTRLAIDHPWVETWRMPTKGFLLLRGLSLLLHCSCNQSKGSMATDPRTKGYGVLRIAGPGHISQIIRPNYSPNFTHVDDWVMLARCCYSIETSQSLNQSLGQDAQRYSLSATPGIPIFCVLVPSESRTTPNF